MTLKERITAVHVLQRFVRLSRTLLPLYSDLRSKKELDKGESKKLRKIKSVYDNFNADPKASLYLVNSDILRMIQNVYVQINECTTLSAKNLYEYDLFIQESDRLIDTWNHQQMN